MAAPESDARSRVRRLDGGLRRVAARRRQAGVGRARRSRCTIAIRVCGRSSTTRCSLRARRPRRAEFVRSGYRGSAGDRAPGGVGRRSDDRLRRRRWAGPSVMSNHDGLGVAGLPYSAATLAATSRPRGHQQSTKELFFAGPRSARSRQSCARTMAPSPMRNWRFDSDAETLAHWKRWATAAHEAVSLSGGAARPRPPATVRPWCGSSRSALPADRDGVDGRRRISARTVAAGRARRRSRVSSIAASTSRRDIGCRCSARARRQAVDGPATRGVAAAARRVADVRAGRHGAGASARRAWMSLAPASAPLVGSPTSATIAKCRAGRRSGSFTRDRRAELCAGLGGRAYGDGDG